MRVYQISEAELKELPSPDAAALLADPAQPKLWIDLEGPTDDDIRLMRDVLHFHPLAIEDTINLRQRPKMEEYNDHLFIILNAVSLDTRYLSLREIDVFASPHLIVTVHASAEPVIEAALHNCKFRAASGRPLTPGFIGYSLLDASVDGYFPVLDAIEEELDDISEKTIEKARIQQLNRLLEIRRNLTELARIIGHQRDVMSLLRHEDQSPLMDESLRYYIRDVYDHVLRVSDMVNMQRDTLMSAIDLYYSAQSNRLNLFVQRLTFATILIGMMTVISGFYGMNFEHTFPPFTSDWGVPFVLLTMFIAAVGITLLARRAEL